MKDHVEIKWLDGRREPSCAPDPAYPEGRDIVLGGKAAIETRKHCKFALPYPAKRCGMYFMRCTECSLTAVITTAGRPDDPRTVTMACLMSRQHEEAERAAAKRAEAAKRKDREGKGKGRKGVPSEVPGEAIVIEPPPSEESDARPSRPDDGRPSEGSPEGSSTETGTDAATDAGTRDDDQGLQPPLGPPV
jgi:hypothetical protein